MERPDVRRAIDAATSAASSAGLRADDAVVLHNSNKLALRLVPCDVLARVTPPGQGDAQLELVRARKLSEVGCPVGIPAPDVDPVVHTHGGFAVTLWVYYEPVTPRVAPDAYAGALELLHTGMGRADLASPRFTDRIADAERIAGDPGRSPDLTPVDRAFLGSRLVALRRAIESHSATEQLLHGEPHPGNLLSTRSGPRFVDFETICTGPVEFDLAHVPRAVCDRYPNVDASLLDDCRELVLAMVAAWRWDRADEFPDGMRWRREFLRALRAGPPWPTLDELTGRFDSS